MSGTVAIEVIHPSRALGGPDGVPVSVQWLRRGLATFLWASIRSLTLLHLRAARAMARTRTEKDITEGIRYDLAGSFVQFLFERGGEGGLRTFFMRSEEGGIDSAARQIVGRPILELEMEWESMLRRLNALR